MPKSAGRRKRIRAARTDAAPTALPDPADKKQQQKSKSGGSNGKANGEGGSKVKELLPIVQKLRSNEATERLWSTSAVSHILSTADSSTRRLLQSNNVVALLIERLADAELQVQSEACGALRNLAIEGGFEVCAEMFNKAVVPALAKQLDPLLGSLVADLEGKKAADDKERSMRKLLWVWTENLASLFWCLAETSDKAFKAVAALSSLSNLLYTVLKHAVPIDGSSINKAKIPVTLALAAAQAVYVLTDSNVPSAPNFPLPRDTSRSAAYANTKSMLLASLRNLSARTEEAEATEKQSMFNVLLIGIFQNLTHQQAYGKQVRSEEDEDFARLALQILTSGLEGIDLVAEAQAALEAHQSLPEANAVNSAEAAELSEPKVKLDHYEARWTRLRLTLEILGELFGEMDGIVDAGLLGGEVYEEWHGIENAADEAMEADNTQGAGTSQQHPTPISQDALSIFARMPQLLLGLAHPTSLSFALRPVAAEKSGKAGLIATQPINGSAAGKSYVPVLSDLVSLLHARSLECLNNLLITVGRSGIVAEEAAPAKANDAVDDSMMLLAEEGAEPLEQDGEDDEDMVDEGLADQTLQNGNEEVEASESSNALTTYVSNNIESLQKAWEGLFELLVGFTSLLEARTAGNITSVTDGKEKKKGTAAAQTPEDALETTVEANAGSIWALARLCVNRLTVGSGEGHLLLKAVQLQGSSKLPVDARIRVVGALSVLASRSAVSQEENKAIGQALLSQISPLSQASISQDDAELYTQAIDSIIDVYSDETRDYDTIFVQGGFLQALETVVPAYKKLVKGIDKRKYPDLRTQADGVAINITEFVKYRKSL